MDTLWFALLTGVAVVGGVIGGRAVVRMGVGYGRFVKETYRLNAQPSRPDKCALARCNAKPQPGSEYCSPTHETDADWYDAGY